MRFAFTHARVLAPQGWLDDHAVLVADGRIAAVLPTPALDAADLPRRDLAGARLAPGFIDCQVNGGGDVLFNDAPDLATLERLAAAHARYGTCRFLPTLISSDAAHIAAAVAAVGAARGRVPAVLGLHLEGPFLASARRGVHDVAHFRTPEADFATGLDRLAPAVRLVTLAPECVPAGFIADLTARGVIVCAGHTAADYATLRAAAAQGVRGITHLYNAMSPLQSREPGVVGAALDDDALWCGVIVDGHHVHPAALRLALRAKPRGKLFLVTDAMPPVGGDTTTFQLGGLRVHCRDGRCETDDGTLAGACLDMASAVRNAVAQLGLADDEALRMASTYPADFLGLADQYGRIAPGAAADLVVLDEALAVRETWVGGERVFAVVTHQRSVG